ncbi:MAG: SDR family oxidoreductase [Elusimicrobia bacterium]|nr:SDR family oxidoreductase [Elusimicrobiota bacterium]
MTKRTVMITGASRGLGLALVRAFAPEAGLLVLAAREAGHIGEARRAAADCPVHAAGGDLSSREGISRLLSEVGPERLGAVDVLVNNAGWGQPGALADSAEDDVVRTYFTDLIAPALLCRAAAGGMIRRRWGRIVNISSITAVQPSEGLAAYASAKAGLNALTKSLSAETARHGVTVNAIMPGLMLTDMGRDAVAKMGAARTGSGEAEVLERIKRSVPLRKLTEVSEVAALVRWLAGDEAAFLTGQVIGAAGGL